MARVKKVLVTGAGGLLGSEFRVLAEKRSHNDFEIIPQTHKELDITSPEQVDQTLSQHRLDFLINCAAYTNVDGAESEGEKARQVNIIGPQVLAEACRKHGVKLIHFSTDFVFDGEKKCPYVESDEPSPINQYGQTKLEGEKKIQAILPDSQSLILRISWPYGKNGKNFIHTLWELSKTRPEVRVVRDQVGIPNPASLIAKKSFDLIEEASGVFHFSCKGACSRYDLICFLLDQLHSPCKVVPVSSDEFPLPAKRPAYSALGTERKDLQSKLNLPTWQEALIQYIDSFK